MTPEDLGFTEAESYPENVEVADLDAPLVIVSNLPAAEVSHPLSVAYRRTASRGWTTQHLLEVDVVRPCKAPRRWIQKAGTRTPLTWRSGVAIRLPGSALLLVYLHKFTSR